MGGSVKTVAESKRLEFVDRWNWVWILIFFATLPVSKSIVEISSTCVIGGWLLGQFCRPHWPPGNRITNTFLGFYMAVVLFSFFWSEFPNQSFRGIFKVLQQIGFFFAVSETLVRKERNDWLFNLLILTLVVLSIDGFWQYFFQKDFFRQIPVAWWGFYDRRISGPFTNYGNFAAHLVGILPLCLALGLGGWFFGPKRRIASSVAFILGLISLFFTHMRGAWLASVGGFAFFFVFYGRKVTWVILAVVLGLLLFLLPYRMIIHVDEAGGDRTAADRLILWSRAVDVIRAKPWTGTGINTYAVAHEKFTREKSQRVYRYYAHNGYLQMAAELGLPGLLFFLAFLVSYFYERIRFLLTLPRSLNIAHSAILSGCFGFLLFSLLDTSLHNLQAVMLFWFLMGWGLGMEKAGAQS